MKNNLRFCLVGRGSIGTRHLNNLKSLSYHNIIAFSETPNKDKDAEYKNKYGIKTVHNIKEVRDIKPDAFIVANPTAKHMEFAEVAVDMNSHIFMEKPLSHNLKGADELKKGLSDKNLVFCLANNFRFHPALIKIKRLVEDNAFGEIYFARIMAGQYLPDWHPWEDYKQSYSAKKELGGGVVLTLQHEIDYAYWLFGKFKSLKSRVKKVSDLQIDVEDIASIIIETESGQLIEVHLDYLQRPPKRSIQIQGSKGSIDYRFGDRYLLFYDFIKQGYETILDLESYDNNQMYVDEIQNFIKCISGEEKPQSSIGDAIYVLNTCLWIKKESIQ
jgi:predicted dehydrogenase